jgi:D-alanyl-lipoteichoic acid acyltransferase DltB (MBOAT superfamily)
MLFNSLEFGVFLALVLLGHFVLLPARWVGARKGWLLFASYLFYASWNPFFSLLLAFSTAVDFGVGLALERAAAPRARRALLGLSLLANLGLLGFFKYGRFAADAALGLAGGALRQGELPWLEVALPVGISFYTFQSLSYSIDVYRRQQPATRSWLDFALYVSFFPQLVAGPIVRARDLLPQLSGPRRTRADDVHVAVTRIAAGLVKKVVLADGLGVYVDAVFAQPEAFVGVEVALALYAFAFQILLDFSGYCDIAIGLGRLFGVRLPENFDRPYLAASVREFWRRWHITLSTWLRDYVYVSLGGNRHGPGRTGVNLMATMVLGGLWHGAGYGFLLWGAYHGALLVIHRAWVRARGGAASRVPRGLAVLCTFHLVLAGWLLFRAPSLEVAGALLARLPVGGFAPDERSLRVLGLLAVIAAIQLATRTRGLESGWRRLPAPVQGAGFALVAFLVYLASGRTHEFIYFQF